METYDDTELLVALKAVGYPHDDVVAALENRVRDGLELPQTGPDPEEYGHVFSDGDRAAIVAQLDDPQWAGPRAEKRALWDELLEFCQQRRLSEDTEFFVPWAVDRFTPAEARKLGFDQLWAKYGLSVRYGSDRS